MYQITSKIKDKVEVVKYSLSSDNVMLSPAVDINGFIYYLKDMRWLKKAYKANEDPDFISIRSINLSYSQSNNSEEPERRNLYYIGIVLLVFLIGGGIGFAYQKYKNKRDGPQEVDPKNQPCSQDVGVAENYDNSFN